MEPGGESTQYVSPSRTHHLYTNQGDRYESIRTVTNTPPKQKGQLGANEKNTISELKIPSRETNEQRDSANMNLNDPQFAGMTSNVSGEVDRDLKPDVHGIDEEARRTRAAQKLGRGNNIGA
ncbi:hypothetical protein UA08_02988 [Talaromyces atroroseus]|uniref:Uncharacterized protein n=1 Tax=Talaromyces atroroseus TaxID=1441469 RepID=A0A225B6Y1_TALAT|nr:hypothetical protein UA08_02988 [Talaromyces atroroseus]OKL61677.1 hypothetical protein UA08_02988 [Talaromyces atroroseus]